jgi:hypothetical protein
MTLAMVTTPGEGESISEIPYTTVRRIEKARSTSARILITLHLTEPAMLSPDQVPSSGREEDEWTVAFEFVTAESKRFLAILQERPVVRRLLAYARNLDGRPAARQEGVRGEQATEGQPDRRHEPASQDEAGGRTQRPHAG